MASGLVPALPALEPGWALWAASLSLGFVGGNLALQYGAARLTAVTGALIMLSEVLFASVSSVLMGAGAVDARTLAGGTMILLAALLASRSDQKGL
jgi:drug/metabolite transporter (DMT)-like permease